MNIIKTEFDGIRLFMNVLKTELGASGMTLDFYLRKYIKWRQCRSDFYHVNRCRKNNQKFQTLYDLHPIPVFEKRLYNDRNGVFQ